MQSAGRVKEVEASLAAARAEKLEAVVSAVHTQTGGGDMTSAETSSASTWRKLEEEREAQLDGALVALKEVDRLQNTVMHCSTLQYAATYCNMLQRAALHFGRWLCAAFGYARASQGMLQHAATCCSILQHTATYFGR